ncbi:hypothetical protein ACFLQU_00110 [Verrucomicrobiota bacterium]
MEKLARIRRKVREHSGAPDAPAQSETAQGRRPPHTGDASVDEIHEKLQRIGKYVRERVGKTTPARPRPSRPDAAAQRAQGHLPERLGMGLEVGTSRLAAAREGRGRRVLMRGERNAFLPVQLDEPTMDLLRELEMNHVTVGDGAYVLGDAALDLANVLEVKARQTMQCGVLDPADTESLSIIGMFLYRTLGKPRSDGETCCFSVPAPPVDAEWDVAAHRLIFEDMLESIGFTPCSVEEGYAVVLSELEKGGHTGIGVSCGGGITSICAAIEAVPVVSFSISRGSDWVDEKVATSLEIPSARATILREGGVDLNRPVGAAEEAVAVHFGQFMRYICEMTADVFQSCSPQMKFGKPADVVFTGGMTDTDGFIDIAGDALTSLDLGFPLGRIECAAQPFTSVSRGCLVGAIDQSPAVDGRNQG